MGARMGAVAAMAVGGLVLLLTSWGCKCGDCRTPPTPGPIIKLEPRRNGNVYTASWIVDTHNAAFGASGQLHQRFTGLVWKDGNSFTGFRVFDNNNNAITATSLVLTIQGADGGSHKISIVRKPNGYFDWKVDDAPLTICDDTPGNCVPDCRPNSDGVPPEFAGTISAVQGPLSLDNLNRAEMKADWVSPCQ